MKLVFYDRASPAAYSDETLSTGQGKIGGSEATVIRIAMGLADDHEVTVVQAARAGHEDVPIAVELGGGGPVISERAGV